MNNNYDRFKEGIRVLLSEKFGNDKVKIVNEKNEEVIAIENAWSDNATLFPLNSLFEAYSHGTTLHELINDLATAYNKFESNFGLGEPNLDFENIKDKVIFEIRNYGDTRVWEKNYLYTEQSAGLSMIYAIELSDTNKFYLTNEIANINNYDIEELTKAAIQNTERLYPATFESLETAPFTDPNNRELLDNIDNNKQSACNAYVLSNTTNCFGAAVLFYPGVQEKISNLLNGDYYAIPSSVHEFMILPCANADLDYLEDVLNGANENVVKPYDVLGSSVLRYNCKENKLGFGKELEYSDELE